MTELRKAAEMALEVLETTWGDGHEDTLKQWEETIQALRQALAQPEREWVGLTNKDVHDAFKFTELVKQLSWEREPQEWCENFAAYHTIAYCEAKLKEKNLPEGCA